ADGSFTATSAVTVTTAVTGVTLDQTSLSMLTGGADETLTATVGPATASNKNVTWSTSDASVATVANGVVTAVGNGTATITATTADGSFTATSTVTVTTAVTGVTLDQTSLSLLTGGADETLTATVNPATASNKNVTWSTSDASVATVTNGVVSPVGNGTATITVTTTDGSFTATSA
ncbi:Ig-like domain-containing protein, partial [Paenibacillus kobensis]|uniref:Ig-like domain-containing protein n=1 Tax=Paenibacillus kobensis TaxID=59841 RepID=UPI00157FF447